MEPVASRPTRPEPVPDPRALPALLDCEADLDALERGLLVAATHPLTGGAERAWIVRADERRALLEGWRVHEAGEPAGTLAEAIARARRAPPMEPAGQERVRAWAAPTESLDGACGTAWRSGATAEGPGSECPGAPWDGCAWVRAVPLRRGERAHGLLVSGWRAVPAERATAGSEWLAAAATAALGVQVLAAEARRRARQSAAVSEFARLVVSAGHLAEGVHALVRLAAQSVSVRHAALWRVREDGALRLDVSHGPAPARDVQARMLQPAVEACAHGCRAGSGASGATLPGAAVEGANEIALWTLQPVVAYGRTLGVLAVWDGAERGAVAAAWEPGDLETLGTLVDQAALLFDHARGHEERAALERRREDLAARLRDQDRLATLGEMAGRVGAEVRGPLAALVTRLTDVLAGLADEDPRRSPLEAALREGERAGARLGELEDYARLEPARMRMESLNAVAQEALRASAESLARRRVRLVKSFAPDLPSLLLDAARIRRVVGNLVAVALEQLPLGGRIRVETRRMGALVSLEVVHDRSRESGDALEQLFAPFSLTPAPGSGGSSERDTIAGAALGLGVAHQIVREHGGEIRVRIEDEWSSALVMTLPVLDNQDRRRAADRRGPRPDRRRRDPGA